MPAQQFNFTKKALAALPPAPKGKRSYYRDQRYPQLLVAITDKGSKSFQVYAWGAGRPQRVTVGWFNPVNGGGMTIEQARRTVAPMLKKIQGGEQPNAEKRAAREAETVADLADEYIERHAKVKKKSWREDLAMLNRDVIPILGKKKAREVTRRDVVRLVERVADRGAPIQANRTISLLSRMFRFGVGKGIIDSTPCVEIEKPGKETKRDRNLSPDEIKTIWPMLSPDSDDLSMDVRTRLILRLILATGQRPGECRQMEWAEIDGRWWTIPHSKRSKGKHGGDGVDQTVFLNSQALEDLQIAKVLSDGFRYVFPSPLGDQAMTKAALSRAVNRNLDAFGIEPFTAHDLRRTVASRMGDLGIDVNDIERVLGHSIRGIGATYNRSSYDATKRKALEKWGRRLGEIVTGKRRSKVVKLR